MITFQEMIRRLTAFWEKQGCIIHQGYDLETGAGTMNPATFLRCLGPEPYRAAYIEPCRRPTDGRYGQNPNRLQHYFQYQVILKPSPLNLQDLYIQSLKEIGIDLAKHDLRFVHDDWENPTIGAWGLGWEVWIDGMEITQYTYFQSVGGIPVKPVTGELTYGIERLGMYLQNVDSIFDVKWNEFLNYGDIYHRNEVEWSHYNFEEASTEMWLNHFNDYEKEAKKLIQKELPIPAYEFVMKSSHAFNLLDARGAISVSERTKYIGRIRELAKLIATSFIQSREKAGFPLLKAFPVAAFITPQAPAIPEKLLHGSPDEKETFILEIGSEELPAAFIPIGERLLFRDMEKLLKEEKIPYEHIEVYGSPQRLAVIIKGLAKMLPSKEEERRGPKLDSAYDNQGHATRAADGFFKSLGKQPLSLQAIQENQDPSIFIRNIKGVDYLFAIEKTSEQPAAGIFAKKLPELILSLDFPKKMRWADLEITYARPLQWILALFGKEVIPFNVGNLISGNQSKGHRQLSSCYFAIPEAKSYLETLRKHHVIADAKEREAIILKQLDEIEQTQHVKVIERARVLEEVVYLVEWPEVTISSFAPEFLKAPKEVLISEMVHHQKYFPVMDSDGLLTNRFVITANTKPSDSIRKGNQKVLSSRLSDGVFLYEKGLSVPLTSFNEKLKSVTFLSGLGSVYDKVMRLVGHAEFLQKTLKISTKEKAARAALLSKADLVSEMVFEFPELQGTVGKYYALHHGEDPEVAASLEEQWMPRGDKEPLPATETGVLLSLADKIDNLISCFSLQLKPTSSSDPHALRRQTLGLIKILIERKLLLPFAEMLEHCFRNFIPTQIKNKKQTIQEIEEFFAGRIKTVFQDYGFEKNEIEATLANGFSDIYDTFCKVKALHQFRASGDAFAKLFEVYKRAKGQIGQRHVNSFSPALLVEEAEKELHLTLEETNEKMAEALKKQDYNKAYALLAKMQPGLARLFDEVHILADDASIQSNRIALLQRVFVLFSELLDFSKI